MPQKKTLGRIILSIFLASFSLFLVTRVSLAGEACQVPTNPGDYCCSNPDYLAPICLEGIFGNVLKGVLSLVGMGSLAFIIRGGIKYTMSGGDMKAIDEAKKTLTWSLIGLGFSLTSFFALQLLNQTFNANILRFVIPAP